MASHVTIDGLSYKTDALDAMSVFAAATSIVRAGDTRPITVELRTSTGARVRSAVLVTPTSQVSLTVEEEPGNPVVIPIFEQLAPNAVEIVAEADNKHTAS
ncbi:MULTISPECIES: hypothetical protein [unclassified Curtobacterium]|uniref:hypothetical protein n=1 Tax=unclassified Curtobacterium TaxID=257496 RepID=UPI003804731D